MKEYLIARRCFFPSMFDKEKLFTVLLTGCLDTKHYTCYCKVVKMLKAYSFVIYKKDN